MESGPRQANPEDQAIIEDIVQHAYSPYVSRIGREPGPMLDDYSVLIRNGHVYVMENNNTVQGVLVLIPEKEVMLLDNVAVSPAAQGRGLGRRMLEFAERYAKETGYGAIRLYTNEVMTENIRIYSRIGYEETHRGEERGLKRVYMVKKLV